MGTINTLKILNEQEKQKEKERKNTTEEQALINKAYAFAETLIMPKINVYDLITDLTNTQAKYIQDEMTSSAVDMIIMFSQVNENNKAPLMLNDNEINFLYSNDMKLKKDIASRIKEYIIKKFTYDDKITKYIDQYIKPIIDDFNDNKMLLVKKYIYNETKESLMFSIFKYGYEEEYINDWNFLFNDNIEAKKEFADITKDFLIKNYDKIDFKNIDKFDMEEYLKANKE